jgi:hypothetical protein
MIEPRKRRDRLPLATRAGLITNWGGEVRGDARGLVSRILFQATMSAKVPPARTEIFRRRSRLVHSIPLRRGLS